MGFYATNAGSSVSVDRCLIFNNGVGARADGGGLVRVSNSEVTGNTAGLVNPGGATVETLGHNTVRGNATDTFGVITTVAPQ
jgi:hypothetical protein